MESGDSSRRTRSASPTTSWHARRQGAGDHVPWRLSRLSQSRGRSEAIQEEDTGNHPILAGRCGGAPASHGTQRRRRRGNDQGRTVNQMPTGGGRYFKYRPPPRSWQPLDRACVVQINSQGFDLSFSSVIYSARRDAGGRAAWPAAAVALSLGGECPPINNARGLAASLLKRSSPDDLWTKRTCRPRRPPGKEMASRLTASAHWRCTQSPARTASPILHRSICLASLCRARPRCRIHDHVGKSVT